MKLRQQIEEELRITKRNDFLRNSVVKSAINKERLSNPQLLYNDANPQNDKQYNSQTYDDDRKLRY